MRANEFLTEDDYYPPADEDLSAEYEIALQKLVANYVNDSLGEPHRANVGKHFNSMKVFITIPRYKLDPATDGKRIENMKQEWAITAEDLQDEIRRNDLGEFEITRITPFNIELEETTGLYETTTAGGVAVGALGGVGKLAFGNPSIYDNVGKYVEQPKKAKKKKDQLK